MDDLTPSSVQTPVLLVLIGTSGVSGSTLLSAESVLLLLDRRPFPEDDWNVIKF